MKISDSILPPILPSNSPLDMTRHATGDPMFHRRRTEKPVFAIPGARRRRNEAPAGRVSGLCTPLLRRKLDDGRDLSNSLATGRRGFRRVRFEPVVSVSARHLAAGLWWWAAARRGSVKSQCEPFDRLGFQHHSLSPFPKFAMEGATKWDPGYSKISTEVCHFLSHVKLLENQAGTVSVVSALRAELAQARARIRELETDRQSSKKKVEHLLRQHDEERTSWMRREHQKVRAVVDDLKHELKTERRNCQRMEIVNSKLVSDLADAKLYTQEFIQNYEKERKTRELLEETCHDVTKNIEDKTKVEALKRESTRICEEVDEERKMLQMAEVWREERVQMKLVDAKLILEEKYCQMNNLISDLETFLRLRDAAVDTIESSDAEVIIQAVKSVDIQNINEYSYVRPKSNDKYSTIENLQNDEAKTREIDQCLNYSCASHASKIQASPEFNFNKNHVQKDSNVFIDHDRGLEDTSGLENVTNAEDQGSSCSPNGSNRSVNLVNKGRYILSDRTEPEENAGQESLNTEISEIFSVPAKQPKKKLSSVCKLWRSCPSNGDVRKKISVEGNRRLSNGSSSHLGTISSDGRSVEGGVVRHDLVGQWSSPDLGNPHIARGMNGCIEWSRGIHRYSLKGKLLEARVESQNTQLR